MLQRRVVAPSGLPGIPLFASRSIRSLPGSTRTRHSSAVRHCLLAVALPFLAACSSGQVPLPRAADITILGLRPAPTRPRNVLYRDEVDAAIASGLAYFLQKVDLEAQCETTEQTLRKCSKDAVDQKRFVGFKVTAMRPAMAWMPFDFAPGDIVTHVNGTSVEHYDTVIPLFESLAKANAVEVSVLRGTQTATVVVRIDGRNVASARP